MCAVAFCSVDNDHGPVVESMGNGYQSVCEFRVDVSADAPTEHVTEVLFEIPFTVRVDDKHHVAELACGILRSVNDFAGIRRSGDLIADEGDGMRGTFA